MFVFWVEASDHAEDWFVAANSSADAINFFASEMGYDHFKDGVCAVEVIPIPNELSIKHTGFMDNQQLKDCGGEFIEFHDEDLLIHIPEEFLRMVAGETRIVRFGKKVYMEGNVMRLALQKQGKLFLS